MTHGTENTQAIGLIIADPGAQVATASLEKLRGEASNH